MAYNDENYGNALEAALAKMIARHAVGEMWVGFSMAEKPAGVLLRDASLQSRGLYAGLWQWAQDKGLVLTEAEWQAEYAANGVCHKYSDGDGSTTFRMPSAPLYIKGAENAGQAGAYVAEGLPNITGKTELYLWTANSSTDPANQGSGAIEFPDSSLSVPAGGSSKYAARMSFDASLSNSIYGASAHVTPATSKLLFGVWAVSTAGVAVPDANAEEILGQVQLVASAADAAQASADAALAELAGGVVKSVNGETPDANGNVDIVIGGAAQAEAYIVETWKSGRNWYRKWSDGWIEQGGNNWRTSLAPTHTITFPVAFTQTHATIVLGGAGTTGTGSYEAGIKSDTTPSKTGFTAVGISGSTSTSNGTYWYACGY